MADNTKIEWADATLNYVNGCSVVSPGCTNCYAMRLAGTRMKHHPTRAGLTQDSKAGPVWTGEVRAHEPALLQALKWKRPRRIFWNAHGDLFHENVPDEWIDRLFAVCALTPQHTHMILTKRAGRMREYFAAVPQPRWIGVMKDVAADYPRPEIVHPTSGGVLLSTVNGALRNVWLGVSVEDQVHANERIPDLLATPAAVRFISAEPLLGPVDLTWIEFPNDRGGKEFWDALDLHEVEGEPMPDGSNMATLDWVIAGGESGPGARPMHPDWARSLRDQCAAAGVAFHFKQVGEWGWIDREQHHKEYAAACNGEGPWPGYRLLDPNGTLLPGTSMDIGSRQHVRRVAKARAGRLLDGIEHNGLPS